MLNSNQLSHLEETERDINDKKLILKTAIDIQALLRLLVEKEIISKDEMDEKREEVSSSSRYSMALQYIKEAEDEIRRYKNDPEALLREMFNRKINN